MTDIPINAESEDFKRRNKRPLWGTFSISVALHVLVISLIGGVVVFKVFERPPAQFAPPPPPTTPRLEPRKLEHQVKVNQQQQKSGRPRVSPRLTANKISEYSLPEIKPVAAKVKDPIKSTDVKSFGTGGLGSGTAGGSGAGGLGLGTSQVMMFGFKTQTERVAVLIDLSPSMVEDQRGGFDGFDALKREIKDVIRALNEGSFFNLVMFDASIDVFQAEAVIANRKNKDAASEWIDPYMTNREDMTKNGTALRNGVLKPETPVLAASGGVTRYDLAVAAAMESGVDTIFVITDGAHNIRRVATPEQEKEWERLRNDPVDQKRLAKMNAQLEEEWRKEAEDRARRGLPPRIVELRGGYGYGPDLYDDATVLDYVKKLVKTLYTEKGKKPPRIYVVGYVSDPREERFLRMLSQQNGGSFRRTRTLVKPIDTNGIGKRPASAVQ